MKNKLFNLTWFIIILLLTACRDKADPKSGNKDSGKCYYVSTSGRDNSSGSRMAPWKTLNRISNTNLNPGDTVLFEGSAVFSGTIYLDSLDSGEDGKQVVLGSYGSGRAIIDGEKSEGIIAKDCNHFVIRDLIVQGSGRNKGNLTDGVYIKESNNFRIDSIELSGFQHSGLHIHICSDVDIRRVYAHDNGFAGIHITGNTISDSVNYDNKNIYIGYSVAENNPGDPTVLDNHSGNGILVSSAKGGTIEYCEAFNNGWDMPWTGNGPVGIWIWDCRDITIQYCIAHDNKTRQGAKDGGGFDLDGGVSNSVIQYCLSYNNQGAGYGLFEFGAAKPWENNTVRYNISHNDGSVNGASVAIWCYARGGSMRNCEIYNNTFYNNTATGFSLMIENNCPGFKFRNNIFIYKNDFLIPGQKLESELFQANSYWSLSGEKRIAGFSNFREWVKATGNEKLDNRLVGLFADPGLQNYETCSITDPGKLNSDNLSNFKLRSGSPLIDRGLNLKNLFNIDPGLKDIAGKPVPNGKAYEIGAMEFMNDN